jgi:hypothetical protein
MPRRLKYRSYPYSQPNLFRLMIKYTAGFYRKIPINPEKISEAAAVKLKKGGKGVQLSSRSTVKTEL